MVGRLSPRLVDETDFGFGWIGGEKPKLMMASHALAADGRVWLVDPTDEPGLDERLRGLGEPAGVIQLLDRHNRGAAAAAARLRVPHHVVLEISNRVTGHRTSWESGDATVSRLLQSRPVKELLL